MELLLAGLAGVVVGALVAAAIILHVLQKRADRDLIERRIRVCGEYLDCLGDLERALAGAEEDERLLDQAWVNARTFRREFLLTGWLLSPEVRRVLAEVIRDLERLERAHEANGSGGARAVQILCEKYHQIRRVLGSEMAASESAHRAIRFFPEIRSRRE